jgi:hypothetical protein
MRRGFLLTLIGCLIIASHALAASAQTKAFAATNLNADSSSVIVVGDAKKFLPALQKVFSQVEVIPVGELNLNSATLRRPAIKSE